MVCVCSMLTIGSAQVAFAGPSTGYESDMVATVAADLRSMRMRMKTQK